MEDLLDKLKCSKLYQMFAFQTLCINLAVNKLKALSSSGGIDGKLIVLGYNSTYFFLIQNKKDQKCYTECARVFPRQHICYFRSEHFLTKYKHANCLFILINSIFVKSCARQNCLRCLISKSNQVFQNSSRNQKNVIQGQRPDKRNRCPLNA